MPTFIKADGDASGSIRRASSLLSNLDAPLMIDHGIGVIAHGTGVIDHVLGHQ
jgi:hypothetical protein